MIDNRLVEIRVFKAVAEIGSFTAAAEALGISQPYATRLLTELEQRLGVTLLHRSTRGQRLTEEGRDFLADCNHVLEVMEDAQARASTSAQQMGLLRIGLPLVFGMDQVVPLLPQFLEAHPGLSVRISLSDSQSNLIDDEIDVVVRMGRLEDSSLVAKRLCDLRRLVVAAPSYISRHGMPAHPDELLQHQCLLWHGPLKYRNTWPFIVGDERADVTVQGSISSTNSLALMELLKAGAGIGHVAEHVALPLIRRGDLVQMLEGYCCHPELSISAVFRRERRTAPRIRAFVDFLSAVFVQPPWIARPQE
jgi:DNA-binding transcriptional LysR family regulator